MRSRLYLVGHGQIHAQIIRPRRSAYRPNIEGDTTESLPEHRQDDMQQVMVGSAAFGDSA